MSDAITSTIPLLAYAAPKVNDAGEVVVALRSSERVIRLVGARDMFLSLARDMLALLAPPPSSQVSARPCRHGRAGVPLRRRDHLCDDMEKKGAAASAGETPRAAAAAIHGCRTPEYRAAVCRAVERVKAGESVKAAAVVEGVKESTLRARLCDIRTGRIYIKSQLREETLAKYRRVIARIEAGELPRQAAFGEGARFENFRVWRANQRKKQAAAEPGRPLFKPSGALL
jgi:hypothetical protein